MAFGGNGGEEGSFWCSPREQGLCENQFHPSSRFLSQDSLPSLIPGLGPSQAERERERASPLALNEGLIVLPEPVGHSAHPDWLRKAASAFANQNDDDDKNHTS